MIKGITPRLAECGKIKIGGLGEERPKRGGGTFRLPVKLNHFLITTTNRTPAGDLEIDAAMMAGIKPDSDNMIRSIPIVLHADDIDAIFPTTYALYSGRRCACRGDGETALRREIKGKQYTGEEKTINCPCSYLGASSGPMCKPNGQLRCSIAVPGSAIAGAVHVWRTTSIISIEQMIGSLLQIKAICGTLRGIPLWLRVRPITVQPAGQKTASTVYCCHVELRHSDIEQIQRDALEATKRRCELGLDDDEYGRMLTLALPAQGETTEEESDIAQEFYPEDGSNTNGDEEPDPGAESAGVEQTEEPPSQTMAERMAQEAKQTDPPSEDPTPKVEVVTKPADPETVPSASEVAPQMVALIMGRLRTTYKMSDAQIKMALGGPIEGAPLEELQRVIADCEKHFLNQKKVGDSTDEQLALGAQGQTKKEEKEEEKDPNDF